MDAGPLQGRFGGLLEASAGLPQQKVSFQEGLWLSALLFTPRDGSIGEKKVEVSVAVEVQPADAKAGKQLSEGVDTRTGRDIDEFAAAGVGEQRRPFAHQVQD